MSGGRTLKHMHCTRTRANQVEEIRKRICAKQNEHANEGDSLPEPTFHPKGIDSLVDADTRQAYEDFCSLVDATYENAAHYNATRWPDFWAIVLRDWAEDQAIVQARTVRAADKEAERAIMDAEYRATLTQWPWLGTSVADDPGATATADA